MAGTKKHKPLSGTLQKKRQKILAWKIFFVFILALIFLGLVIYGLNRIEIQIKDISVDGTRVLDSEEIKKFALGGISEKYIALIPETNIFVYPRKNIEKTLREKFPRIKDISFSRVWFTGLKISVTEREESYLWCGKDFIAERGSSDQCFFVDDTGYIFSEAPFYSGNLFLEFYGPSADKEIGIGKAVLEKSIFDRLTMFIDSLVASGLVPQKIANNGDGDYDIYLSSGGRLILAEKNDWLRSGQNLFLALEAEPLKTKIKEEREKLLYIDLRFPSKVYYKFE